MSVNAPEATPSPEPSSSRTPAQHQQQRPTIKLLSASQPDFIRAVQKDDVYKQLLIDSCHEAVRRTLGPYAALQYNRQSRLLALLLYHGLTTGCGVQTLGEEYCNMMQAMQGTAAAPGLPRQLALVLLQSLAPHVTEAAAQRIDRLAAAQQEQRAERAERAGEHLEERGDDASPSDREADSAPPPPSASRPWSRVLGAAAGRWIWPAASPGRIAASRYLLSIWPTRIRPSLSFIARLHLALFYCYGAYYQISHRLVGVRYISTSRPLQGRTSYRALGLLLVLQLGVVLLLGALQEAPRGAWTAGGPAAAAAGRCAVVLEEEAPPPSRPRPGAETRGAEEVHVPRPAPACPLCLSPRRHPASTPCGHVFCWSCVAQWCNEKPECPLCRTHVLLPQLVPLYHSELF